MDRLTRGNLQYWWRKMTETGVPCLFDSSGEFAQWSVKNGYEYGKRLRRIDSKLEYSPDNCVWVDLPSSGEQNSRSRKHTVQKLVAQWDDFVKPIRECYKVELEQIAMGKVTVNAVKEEPKKRQTFCYEHPDLVREGILFTGGAE